MMPRYKYKIRMIDYDCDVIDGHNHYSGGPILILLELDHSNNEWYEADQWGCEGMDFINEISAWEDDAAGR